MKKIFAILLCILFLGACSPVEQKPTETASNPADTNSSTVGATQQQETENATEDATVNNVMQVPPYQDGWDAYLHAPNSLYVFTYNENSEYDRLGSFIDRSSMIPGALYAIDTHAGSTSLITDKPITVQMNTSEHIYYVLEDEPRKVYRTDFAGGNITVIYESDYGNISFLDYYGVDSNGKLLVAEQNRIISYEIPTEKLGVLMETYSILSFVFSPYSVAFDDVVQNIRADELGPTIFWHGKYKINEDEKAYYYIMNTGEHWDVRHWTPKR